MRALLVLLFATLTTFAPTQGARADEDPGTPAPLATLKILIVSPEAARGHGAGLEKLLSERGAAVKRVSWDDGTVEAARAFDLVVVTGETRRLSGSVVKGYDRPVLGLGSYGHAWFGSMRLKHGSPFS